MNTDNQQETPVSEADIGWLAGIIDGEGSISLAFCKTKKSRLWGMSPRIEIGNTDKELVEKFVRIVKALGGGIYMNRKKESAQSKLVRKRRGYPFKPIYYAKAVGYKRSKKILDAVVPYLTGEKLQRGILILDFIDNRLKKMNGNKRPPWGKDDYRKALAISQTMRSKFTSVLEGILRDYTRGPQSKAA